MSTLFSTIPPHGPTSHVRNARAPAVCRDANTDADDQRLYDLTDANMNVTTLVDSAGDAVERYVYDAYGVVTIYDATWSSARSASSVDNPILFAGYYRDPETRLYHVRHRFYSAELGTWLSCDPLGYVDGMNLYEYVASGPAVRLDPSGTDGLLEHAGAFVGGIGDALQSAKEGLTDFGLLPKT